MIPLSSKMLAGLRSTLVLPGIATLWLAATPSPAHATHAPRIEVQDNGSIQAAAADLSAKLGLTPAQASEVAHLMHDRATTVRRQFDTANAALQQEAEPLLTAAQRQQVPWPAMRWTAIEHWTRQLSDLRPPQVAGLEPLVKKRNEAIRAALMAGQSHYTTGLEALLTPAQKQALVDGGDAVVYIPMR